MTDFRSPIRFVRAVHCSGLYQRPVSVVYVLPVTLCEDVYRPILWISLYTVVAFKVLLRCYIHFVLIQYLHLM